MVWNLKLKQKRTSYFFCDFYRSLRERWIQTLSQPENFETSDEKTKLEVILNDPKNVKTTAQFIADAFGMRRKILNT